MENSGTPWNTFLNHQVCVILNDPPDPNPKKKEGVVVGITDTHLILASGNKTEALLLTLIRRIEIR